jgi:hypothetical protein
VTADRARKYRVLAEATLYAIRNPPAVCYAVKPKAPSTYGPYDTMPEAEARVRELPPEQFPASVWAMPAGQRVGAGRLVREYPAPPDA